MSRVIFIGQAMPRFKKHPHDWPSLNSWLYAVGITDKQIKKNFLYSALVDYFPGRKGNAHRIPKDEEIKKERARLKKTVKDFAPDVVVPVGKLSITNCLGTKVPFLSTCVGRTYFINPYGIMDRKAVVIPLPHPSGASVWYQKVENKKLLKKALELLKNSL
jgi:uracil-DNA glycosylase